VPDAQVRPIAGKAGKPIPTGFAANPLMRTKVMLKTISAAVLAASLIAGPALAQGANTETQAGANANTSTMAKPAAKTAHKTTKHVTKHTKHAKKHVKQVGKSKKAS